MNYRIQLGVPEQDKDTGKWCTTFERFEGEVGQEVLVATSQTRFVHDSEDEACEYGNKALDCIPLLLEIYSKVC